MIGGRNQGVNNLLQNFLPFVNTHEVNVLYAAITRPLISCQGEGSRKPPLRYGKKDPWWCQSQGLSTSRRTQVDAPM